jgi:hypothetical protein
MQRFFQMKTSFGTESTAAKIIYGIKDARYPKSTNTIHNVDALIGYLAIAIEQVMNYTQYQKLDIDTKNDIRQRFIKELGKVCKQQKYEADNVNFIRSPDPGRARGLQLQQYYNADLDVFEDEIAIHFPPKLFYYPAELAKHLVTVLKQDYPQLLSTSGEALSISMDKKTPPTLTPLLGKSRATIEQKDENRIEIARGYYGKP